MEKQVIYRPRQQVLHTDLGSMQTFVREAIDHIVGDVLIAQPGYRGFSASKTGATQVTLQPGRLYSSTGQVWLREGSTVKDLDSFRPAVAKKKVAVVAWASGNEEDTDIQQRKFRINAETNQVEPDDVPMRRQRAANVDFIQGVESADPQLPAIDANYVHLATVDMSPTGVDAVSMIPANEAPNLDLVESRVQLVEGLMAVFEGLFVTLRSDIAALAALIEGLGDRRKLVELAVDMARVKEALEIEDTAISYEADRFLDDGESDITDPTFNCRVQEGARFGYDNTGETSLQLFNPIDTRVKVESGFVLPAYTAETRIRIDGYAGDIALANYTQEIVNWVERTRTRTRIIYGETTTVCTNSQWWQSGNYDPQSRIFTLNGETFNVSYDGMDGVFGAIAGWRLPKFIRVQNFHETTETETYWDRITNNVAVSGATIGQTFHNAQAGWFLGPKVFFTEPAAAGDVHCIVCECTAGSPDTTKAIAHMTLQPSALKRYPEATHFSMPPVFLEAGKRYAVVFTSTGAHRLAVATQNRYTAGTLFTTTDGAWFNAVGNQDRDLLLELPFARFAQSYATVELAALSLAGGMSDIDMLFEAVRPGGCKLVFEYQPQASSEWYPIADPGGTTPLNLLPPLVRLRAVFVGSPDVMPGFSLLNSRVRTYRLKTAMKHRSILQTASAPTSQVKVIAYLEGFDAAHHTATLSLRVGSTTETADVVEDKVIPPYAGSPGGIRREATFNLGAPITEYKIDLDGTTDTPLVPFHFSERVRLDF